MNTPRTDAALPAAVALRDSVLADVSRTLERELSASRAECARLREALTIVSAVDMSQLPLQTRQAVGTARAALQEVTP